MTPGFLLISLYLVWFSLCSSVFSELRDNRSGEKFAILTLKPQSHVNNFNISNVAIEHECHDLKNSWIHYKCSTQSWRHHLYLDVKLWIRTECRQSYIDDWKEIEIGISCMKHLRMIKIHAFDWPKKSLTQYVINSRFRKVPLVPPWLSWWSARKLPIITLFILGYLR